MARKLTLRENTSMERYFREGLGEDDVPDRGKFDKARKGKQVRSVLIVLAGFLLVACGGGDAGTDTVTFAFRMRGLGPAEEFRVSSASPDFIAQARAQLALPAAQRRLFAAGPIRSGNGGYNLDWSWHFTRDVALAEVTIELCDGRPSMVEADLDYWLGTVRSFCPWGSYVYAEVR